MDVTEVVKSFLLSEPIFAGLVPKDVNLDFALIDSGALDSIGIFSLVSFLETTFKIAVEPQDLNETNFQSLRTIEIFVRSRKK
jgi:acyl carrier protein